MDVQVDRLGKIQAEDTHDGLCINYVSIEPYVVYYWKESGMFIMEGENYAADM